MRSPILFDKNQQLTYDKLVQARSFIFSLLGLIASIAALCIDIYLQYYTVAFILCGMIISLAIAIWLCLAGFNVLFKLLILFIVNGLLLVLSFAEGGDAFVFVFYFPVILVVPFILPDNKKYNIELFIYVMVTAIFTLISIFLVPDQSNWEHITPEGLKLIKTIDCVLALSLTVFVTLGIIFSERYFKDVLYQQKDKAESSNRMKGMFLSGTSHELRTSLNGITGTTHLLESEQHLPEQENHFAILKYCAEHMLNIVNEILDLDKIESGKFELHPGVFKISQLLEDAHSPFIEKLLAKKIQYKAETDPEIDGIYLYADNIRILQVLHNLLSNAVKFTYQGSIKLTAKLIEKEKSKCSILFSVEDTGIGISEEHQQKIFENFWQAYSEKNLPHRGTGLGLPLSKRILELMNSSIKVQSTLDSGSKFSFILELAIANEPVKSEITNNSNWLGILADKTILIAEDDLISMAIAEKILKSYKTNILKAENGIQAINILKENPGIDAVLLDLEMPLMNGYAAVIEIKKINTAIPVIAFTAALIDKQREELLRSKGFSASISKPFNAGSFSKIFHELFKG